MNDLHFPVIFFPSLWLILWQESQECLNTAHLTLTYLLIYLNSLLFIIWCFSCPKVQQFFHKCGCCMWINSCCVVPRFKLTSDIIGVRIKENCVFNCLEWEIVKLSTNYSHVHCIHFYANILGKDMNLPLGWYGLNSRADRVV